MRLTRCQSPFASIRINTSNSARFLSSAHESNAAASVGASHKPASLPVKSSLVALGRPAQVNKAGAASTIRNFLFQQGLCLIRKTLELQSHAPSRITVDHLRVANHLRFGSERYADEE